MSDKITGIEQGIEKNNRRIEIANQVVQWLKETKTNKLVCASLPGEHWYAEHILLNSIEMSRLKDLRGVVIHGVESNRKTAVRSIRYRPENAVIINNSLHYLMTRKLKTTKAGIGYIDETKRDLSIPYNFIFADFCGTPNYLLLKHCAQYMARMDSGVFYATFDISGKRIKGGRNGICRSLNISTKDIKGGISKKLVTLTKKHGKTIHPVYSVVYRGGKLNNTDMITVGFVVGRRKVDVGVIDKDTREILSKTNNASTYQRYKDDPTLFNGRKKRTTGANVTSDQKEEIRTLLARGLSTEIIVSKLGVKMGTVRAMRAHFNHPESFKKKG